MLEQRSGQDTFNTASQDVVPNPTSDLAAAAAVNYFAQHKHIISPTTYPNAQMCQIPGIEHRIPVTQASALSRAFIVVTPSALKQ